METDQGFLYLVRLLRGPLSSPAVGEGSVWFLDVQTLRSVDLDTRVSEKPIVIGTSFGVSGALAVGLGAVWVTIGSGVLPVDPATERLLRPIKPTQVPQAKRSAASQ